MDDDFKNKFDKANEALALKGERILGIAYNKLNPNVYGADYKFIKVDPDKVVEKSEDGTPAQEEYITDIPISNLVFVGLIAMEDPPR
jgi:magnesium-transporting ATPase (P-type)